jgi:hypothetical protein
MEVELPGLTTNGLLDCHIPECFPADFFHGTFWGRASFILVESRFTEGFAHELSCKP